MDGPDDQIKTDADDNCDDRNTETSRLTRRSLLTWLGRASVLGLFSPVIDACVRGTEYSSPDGGDLADFGAETITGFDTLTDSGRDRDTGETGTGDDGSDETGFNDEGAVDAGTEEVTAPTCEDAFNPGSEDLPLFEDWGERTVDRQELATLLATWRLTVDGLVDNPLTLDFCQLRDLGVVNQVTDFHCVEGWSIYDIPWNGVPLSRVLDLAGVKPEARFLKITSVGGKYTESLSLDVAREPKTLLAIGILNNTLSLKHGFPLRIVVPRLLGYKNPKYVTRIELTTEEHSGFWPGYGYTVSGEVPSSRLRDGKY
jgi:hypothetical protein